MLGPSNNTQTGYGLLKLTQGDLTMTATGTGMLNSKLAKSRRTVVGAWSTLYTTPLTYT